MIKGILLLINFIIGGIFINKYRLKRYFFLSTALFLGIYTSIIFFFLCLKIPLNKILVLFPLFLLPFLFSAKIKKIHLPHFNILTMSLSFILLSMFILGLIDTMKYPIYKRDGLGLWLTKAKMIYLDKTIYSENFFNPHRIQDHPRYPLFLPLLEASYFSIKGINERDVKILSIFIWFLILGIIFEVLLKSKGLNCTLLALIILCSIPAYYVMLDGSLSTGYADIPLSLFYLGAFITVYEYFQSGKKESIVLAGLFSAFAIFTKNEGFVIAVSIFITLVFFSVRKKDIWWFLLYLILPILPWLIIRYHLPNLYMEHYLSNIPKIFSNLYRTPTILRNAIFEAFNVRHWGIFWGIVIYIFLTRRNDKYLHPMKYLTMIILIFYIGIFLLTPWDINFQMRIAFPRMLLHITPCSVFLIFIEGGQNDRKNG